MFASRSPPHQRAAGPGKKGGTTISITRPLPAAGPVPAELPATATRLGSIAAIAEQLTELLDRTRDGYAPQSLSGPDPVYVSLDQAAAAAHDLAISVHSALDAIGE